MRRSYPPVLLLLALLACDEPTSPKLARTSNAPDQDACLLCLLKPIDVIRTRGVPGVVEATFGADPTAGYEIVVDPAEAGEAWLEITLNGERLREFRGRLGSSAERQAVTLRPQNHLAVRSLGAPGSGGRIRILMTPRKATYAATSETDTFTLGSRTQVILPAGALAAGITVQLADSAPFYARHVSLASRALRLRFGTALADAGPVIVDLPLVTLPSGDVLRGRVPVAVYLHSRSRPLWALGTLNETGMQVRLRLSPTQLNELATAEDGALNVTLLPEDFTRRERATADPLTTVTQKGGYGTPVLAWTLPQSGVIYSEDQYPLAWQSSSATPTRGGSAIILVHGWKSDMADANDFSELQGGPYPACWKPSPFGGCMTNVGTPDGFPGERYFASLGSVLDREFGNSTSLFAFTYPTYRSFKTTGEALAARLDSLQAADGFGSVVLVAHSMGGLVSRWATRPDAIQASTLSAIEGIITLGTPHLGTPYPDMMLAEFFDVISALDGLSTPGGQSLLPSEATFPTPWPEKPRVIAFGGDLSTRCADMPCDPRVPFVYRLAFRMLKDVEGAARNDGVVPYGSALPRTIPLPSGWENESVVPLTHDELRGGLASTGSVEEAYQNRVVARVRELLESRKPDLRAVDVSSSAVLVRAERHAVCFVFENAGTRPATYPWMAGYYLSSDSTVSTEDQRIGGFQRLSSDSAGAQIRNCSDDIVLPPDLPLGQYYLGLILDETGIVGESDESNNIVLGSVIRVIDGSSDVVWTSYDATSANIRLSVTLSIEQGVVVGYGAYENAAVVGGLAVDGTQLGSELTLTLRDRARDKSMLLSGRVSPNGSIEGVVEMPGAAPVNVNLLPSASPSWCGLGTPLSGFDNGRIAERWFQHIVGDGPGYPGPRGFQAFPGAGARLGGLGMLASTLDSIRVEWTTVHDIGHRKSGFAIITPEGAAEFSVANLGLSGPSANDLVARTAWGSNAYGNPAAAPTAIISESKWNFGFPPPGSGMMAPVRMIVVLTPDSVRYHAIRPTLAGAPRSTSTHALPPGITLRMIGGLFAQVSTDPRMMADPGVPAYPGGIMTSLFVQCFPQ